MLVRPHNGGIDDQVFEVGIFAQFNEKPLQSRGRINGGFFVCNPGVFNVIDDETTVWEQKPLRELVRRRQLSAYRHLGFWQPMDTLRDKAVLDGLWETGKAPWKVWSD